MKSDNLFDTKFTFLDFVKIMLLVVTGFSTFNIVDVFTPDGPLAWVREWAAVLVVEGAFVGFEWATAKAKCRRQIIFATIGFFCSLVVIGLFAGASGLLEFGGKNLIEQPFGTMLGLTLTFGDAISGGALTILVAWILTLASIYRFYSLNDPDAKAEIERNVLYEDMANEDTSALRVAYKRAAPVVASNRALANIQEKYKGELGEAMMGQTLNDVRDTLAEKYQREVDLPATPQEAAPSLGQRMTKVLQDKAERLFNAPLADPETPKVYEQTAQLPEEQPEWMRKAEPSMETQMNKLKLSGFNITFPFDVWFIGRDMPWIDVNQEGRIFKLSANISLRVADDGVLETHASFPYGKLTNTEVEALRKGNIPECFLQYDPSEEMPQAKSFREE